MNERPFFSVIIPTYNRAALIGKAIQSVIEQTYSRWELIIVDDGSTDNTKEAVEAFSNPKIRYVYQNNQERCAARNHGVAEALGQYICFLDSDDYFLPKRLQFLYSELEARDFPHEMFYTPIALEQKGRRSNRDENEVSYASVYDHIALSVIHSQQVCIAKNILKEFQFDTRFHISEDMELWLRIARKYKITLLKNQYTVVIVDHETRTVNDKQKNSYVDQLKTLQHIFSRDHSGNIVSGYIQHRLLANCYFGIAKFEIYKGNRFSASVNVLKSIITDLKSIQLKFRINVLLKLLLFRSFDSIEELIRF